MNEKEFNELPEELKNLNFNEAMELSRKQDDPKLTELYIEIYNYKLNIVWKKLIEDDHFTI